jgi:hypothetical protein
MDGMDVFGRLSLMWINPETGRHYARRPVLPAVIYVTRLSSAHWLPACWAPGPGRCPTPETPCIRGAAGIEYTEPSRAGQTNPGRTKTPTQLPPRFIVIGYLRVEIPARGATFSVRGRLGQKRAYPTCTVVCHAYDSALVSATCGTSSCDV